MFSATSDNIHKSPYDYNKYLYDCKIFKTVVGQWSSCDCKTKTTDCKIFKTFKYPKYSKYSL